MSQLRAITGAAWPTSGAASAGTSGLDTVAGGTHVGSADVPAGSLATGYITGPTDGAFSFRPGATTDIFQANETEAWMFFCIRLVRTATPLVEGNNPQVHITQNSGTKHRTNWYVRALEHNPGMGVWVQEYVAGGVEEKISCCGSSGAAPIIPFNKFVWIAFQQKRSTADGSYGMMVNNVLVQRHRLMNTDTDPGAAQMRAQFSFNWPAIAGVRFELHGGIELWDSVGSAPTLRPMHHMYGPTAPIAQSHSVDCSLDETNLNGKCWTQGGTATRTRSEYGTSGKRPGKFRFMYAGAGVTWNQTIIDAIGPVPYGPRGGCVGVFPMMYFPDGTGQVVVRNFAGTTILTLDIVSNQLRQGATVLGVWTQTARHALRLHFRQSGALSVSVANLTGDNTAPNGWSASLGSWTPGYLGTVTVSGVNVTLTHECADFRVRRLSTDVGVDSLSHIFANTVSPNLAMTNHMADALCPDFDATLIPGSCYPNQIHGMEPRPVDVVSGRSGQTVVAHWNNYLAYMNHASDVEHILVDGGSVNDFNAAPMTNTADQTSILDGMDLRNRWACDLINGANSVYWVTTMLRRLPGTFAWTTLQQDAMVQRSVRLRGIAVEKQFGQMRLSDVAAAIVDHAPLFNTATDSIHPLASGSGEYAKQMVLTFSVPLALVVESSGGKARGRLSLRLGLGI